MSTLSIKNGLVILMLLACFGRVQADGLRVYPSWENPRFVFQGATLPYCRPTGALAQNSNGILRIFVTPPILCPPAFGPTPPTTYLVDRVFDLSKICVRNGNCEANASSVEWFERELEFPASCLVPDAPPECLPVPPTATGSGRPFVQRTPDMTPIFPHPAQGGFVSFNNSREISIGQERGTSGYSGTLLNFANWNAVVFADGIRVGVARNSEQSSNVGQEFLRSARITALDSTVPRFSDYASLAVRPDTIILLLDREVTLLDSRQSFSSRNSFRYLMPMYPAWPWNTQGVFDLNDVQLPMRQFKIESCSYVSNNSLLLTCPLSFDNGTSGQLTVNADNRFVFSYSDCSGPKQIVLALDGAGYSQWYSEDLGPDPFAGTVNALKRGQVRVKLLATRRENAFNLTPGPALVCAKPIWSCRFFRGLWCN
jgi:hypothetical protein